MSNQHLPTFLAIACAVMIIGVLGAFILGLFFPRSYYAGCRIEYVYDRILYTTCGNFYAPREFADSLERGMVVDITTQGVAKTDVIAVKPST